MMPEKHSWQFLFAVLMASVLQAWGRNPERETFWERLLRRLFGVICGFFMAVYFTDFVIAWRELDPHLWKMPVGILLAFTGQSVVEFMIELSWGRVREMIDTWRGARKNDK